jgi:hypothetical protein
MLHAIGLPELVTMCVADYEALALKLARDPQLLAALRSRLAEDRDSFPLFDTERSTRQIEAAYTAMWERAQRGDPPASFAVTTPSGTTDATPAIGACTSGDNESRGPCLPGSRT